MQLTDRAALIVVATGLGALSLPWLYQVVWLIGVAGAGWLSGPLAAAADVIEREPRT